MKTKLLMVGILVLVVAILASYGESIVIMRESISSPDGLE